MRASQIAEDAAAAATPRTTKERLRAHGIRPRKRLGQCFLLSDRDAARIAELAAVEASDVVVEVGAGTGVLTAPLAERARTVVAVEVDDRLYAVLLERFGPVPNVEVVRENYVRLDLAKVARQHGVGKLVVVGNLPYYLTTDILLHTIAARAAVGRMVVLMQREVAARLVAPPGSKEYGSLTVFCRFHGEVDRLMDVRKGAFYPEPEVSSSLVEIRFRTRPPLQVEDEDAFFEVVRAAFQTRRKMIGGSLAENLGLPREELLGALGAEGVVPSLRPEMLDLNGFEAAARAVARVRAHR